MTLLAARRSQFRRSLRRIPYHTRPLHPSLSPAQIQASWIALRQKSCNSTAISPQYHATLEGTKEEQEDLSGGQDTGREKDKTELDGQPEGSSDRDKLTDEAAVKECVSEFTASSFHVEGTFEGIDSQYNAIILGLISKYLPDFPLGTKTVPSGTPHSSSVPGRRTSRATNAPRTAIAGPSKASKAQKRSRCPDDDDDGDESKRNRKRQGGIRVDTPQIKYHVCPFQLREPPTYALPGTPEVCGKGIKPGRVREHLRRHHFQPAQCLNCGRRGDSGQIKEHEERGTCTRRSDIVKVPPEILAIDEKLAQQSKTTWEKVWALLFGPDIPLPRETDRYIQPREGEEIVDALARHFGPSLMQSFLHSVQFQQLQSAGNYSWVTEFIDYGETADLQRESLEDLQTEGNILAAGELVLTEVPSSADTALSQDATIPAAQDLGNKYSARAWDRNFRGPLEALSYGVLVVGHSPGEAAPVDYVPCEVTPDAYAPDEDQARAWAEDVDVRAGVSDKIMFPFYEYSMFE